MNLDPVFVKAWTQFVAQMNISVLLLREQSEARGWISVGALTCYRGATGTRHPGGEVQQPQYWWDRSQKHGRSGGTHLLTVCRWQDPDLCRWYRRIWFVCWRCRKIELSASDGEHRSPVFHRWSWTWSEWKGDRMHSRYGGSEELEACTGATVESTNRRFCCMRIPYATSGVRRKSRANFEAECCAIWRRRFLVKLFRCTSLRTCAASLLRSGERTQTGAFLFDV